MKSNITCPVCSTVVQTKYKDTPYWACPNCFVMFQSPFLPKVFEAAHELNDGQSTGHLMSEKDKDANRTLAFLLFSNWLKEVPGLTLDIGSKYPYLAHCLKMNHGCNAYGSEVIEAGKNYGDLLDVPMFLDDIEGSDFYENRSYVLTEKYKLITMVHVFEHMHEPAVILQRLRSLIAEDGYVFLRMPDHGVHGFERDLTEEHYTIHPFFHCLDSITELLVQTGNLFTIAETYTIQPGQRDYILRPITKAPTLYAGIIAKNEERDLPHALQSIRTIVDGAILVDTGSTDNTVALFHKGMRGRYRASSVYTEASEKDAYGNWQLWDFAQARNEMLRRVDATTADYVIYVDADDQIINPQFVRRALYLDQYDVFKLTMNNEGTIWPQHRIWKTRKGIRFDGACHEYPTIGGFPTFQISHAFVKHNLKPGAGESSNARNLRILEREWMKLQTPRTAFYLGQTHRDGNRPLEAIPFYVARIGMGASGHHEEWLFAHLYLGRCYQYTNQNGLAKSILLKGIAIAPTWSEFWDELTCIALKEGQYRKAVGYAHIAFSPNAIPYSELWRERNRYTDQPIRNMAIAYLQLGELTDALKWAKVAKAFINADDEAWDKFIAGIEAKLIPTNSGVTHPGIRPVIVLKRAGAIGDILMTLNLLPELRAAYPDHDIWYYTHPSNVKLLGFLFAALNVRAIGNDQTLPEGPTYTAFINLIGYPLQEGYPDVPMAQHLLHYFRKEMGLPAKPDFLPQLTLPVSALAPQGRIVERPYVTIQVATGWSVYKNWSLERWAEIVDYFNARGIGVFQIGGENDFPIPRASHAYLGEMQACLSLLARAALHIGLDSFANHVSHYRWTDNSGKRWQTPAVILFGSTQANASGYPENVNLSAGLPCQPCFKEDPKMTVSPRGLCIYPGNETYEKPNHECMKLITVAQVIEAVERFLPFTRASDGVLLLSS